MSSLLNFLLVAVANAAESQSLMQMSVGADGQVSVSEEATMLLDENIVSLISSMKVIHSLDSDVFNLVLQHESGKASFALKETHIFGDGIVEFGLNGSETLLTPSFRTFESEGGTPLALVQMNDNGHITGWATVNDDLVQIKKRHNSSEFEIEKFQDTVDKQFAHLKSHLHIQTTEECDAACQKRTHENEFLKDGVYFAVDYGCDPNNKTCVGLPEFDGAALLQETHGSTWSGTKWSPGCWTGDSSVKTMKIGVVVDNAAKAGDGFSEKRSYNRETNRWVDWKYDGGRWDSEIAHQFNMANVIYQRQLNIRLEVGFSVTWSEASAPRFLQERCPHGTKGKGNELSNQLNDMKKLVSDEFAGGTRKAGVARSADVAATHLWSGCNPSGYGTVGLAWVGTICRGSQATGVNAMNAGWTTFAHELGHNFGADHSFNDGKGKTGGIMDYGDGKLNGQYQFNTKYRKREVCDTLKSNLRRCSQTAFSGSSGTPAVPPTRRRATRAPTTRRRAPRSTRAPTTRRRAPRTTRAPTTPRRRRRATRAPSPRPTRAPTPSPAGGSCSCGSGLTCNSKKPCSKFGRNWCKKTTGVYKNCRWSD